MATYSNNTTVKANASVVAGSYGVPANLYVAPSNGYAIVTIALGCQNGASTWAMMSISGTPFAFSHRNSSNMTYINGTTVLAANVGLDATYSSSWSSLSDVYVGPGQTLQLTGSGCLGTIVGTEFVNTP